MALTPAQIITLAADIQTHPELTQYWQGTANNNVAIRDFYNAIASPDFYVWKTFVQVTEIMQNGFDWTRVDNLTVGKARIWEFMTIAGTLNPSQANVRAGFEACFSNEAGDLTTRQAIYDHSVRLARRAEQLFATGTGTAPTDHGVGPATLAFEGQVTSVEASAAMALIPGS